jgi:hypothetical protein
MSDGVKFVFKTLFKVPIFILAAYFLMNIFGLVTTYFKVQGVEYGLENIVTENNYISTSDLEKLMPQLWALGYSYDEATSTWQKIAYVDEVGFVVQDPSTGDLVNVPLASPLTSSAAQAAQQATSDVNSVYTAATGNADRSPMTRTQYGTSKVIGYYAQYVIIWPLTVYTDTTNGGAFANTTAQVASGFDNGSWQTTATGNSMFTAGAVATTGDFGTDSRSHGLNVPIDVRISNTVVGIKYYADLY